MSKRVSQVRRRSLLLLNEKVDEFDGSFSSNEIDLFMSFATKVVDVIRAPSGHADSNEVCAGKGARRDAICRLHRLPGCCFLPSLLVPFLFSFVEGVRGCNLRAQPLVNKQTALLSLEILVRTFADSNLTKEHREALRSSFEAVLECIAAQRDPQVLSSAFICVATFCAQMGMKLVKYLPRLMTLLLDVFEAVATDPSRYGPLIGGTHCNEPCKWSRETLGCTKHANDTAEY